jgi:hypothetical protein
MEWIRTEMGRRGAKQAELLDHLRDEVRKQVLAEAAGAVTPELKEAACVQFPDPAPAQVAPAAGPPPRQP